MYFNFDRHIDPADKSFERRKERCHMSRPSATETILIPSTQRRTPPGPPPYRLSKSNFAVQRDLSHFLSTLVNTYGDTVQFRLALWPAYLLNRPEDVKIVLQTRAH